MASVLRLKPGTIIGRDFQITRLLAKGGMGAVYVAEQLSTASERALKVMHAQLLEDAKSRERFTQEARICARIESDHVVKVIGAGIDDALETPWIAMELIKGEDLDAVVKARNALPRAEVLEMFRQLCHGLGAAHRIGVIHRDLKLGNILIAESQRSDAPFTVKVLDFGISKVLREHQTDTTAAVGSPMWMAPEQAQKGKLGPSTDIWPLGLIAFRLLTGKLYWKAANGSHAAIKAILIELLISPLAAASERCVEVGGATLPPGFDAWFSRCVARHPDDRFRSAAEALDALVPVLSGGGPLRGPSLWGFPSERDLVGQVPAEGPSPVVSLPPAPLTPVAVPQPPRASPFAVPRVAVHGAAVDPPFASTIVSAAPPFVRVEPPPASASETTLPRLFPPEARPASPGVRPVVARGVGRWMGLALTVGVAAGIAVIATLVAIGHRGTAPGVGGASPGSVAGHVTVPSSPPPHPAPALEDITGVTLGGGSSTGGHTCALAADGGVRCWGSDSFGQLGDGATAASHPVPSPVVGLSGVAAVTAGAGHTCALLSDATVRCWGRNEFGELGDGTTDTRLQPVAVTGLLDVTEVAAGENHTCARRRDGTVLCWGQNEFGQLGDGTTTARTLPAQVHGLTGATALAVRGNHACAVLADATVRCWGRNSYGEVGDGTTENRAEPVVVTSLVGARQVSLGAQHGCAALSDGTARCWGQNHYGQLGDGTTTNHPVPVAVAGLSGVRQLALGNEHSCARLGDHTVRCWGNNQHGQLGDGSTIYRPTPVAVAAVVQAEDIALNRNHGCARLADHTLRCWGQNEDGELGDGTTTDRHLAVPVRRSSGG